MQHLSKLVLLGAMALAVVLFLAAPQTFSQTDAQHGNQFVDENGDGYNDNAPDADGDGIPNGQDPDYVKIGVGKGKGAAKDSGFKDENGDGINDNAADADGDGVPNGQDPDYVRPGIGPGQKDKTGFVDENGDGINDNAPDADGDGIPNGQDPDFVKLNTGKMFGKGKGARFNGFIDEDGDGINDRITDSDGDGIPNGKDADWVRPQDCLGRGAKMGKGFGKSGNQGNGPAGDKKGPGSMDGRGGRGNG